MKLCRDKGFVAADPDNVDAWTNNNGLNITAEKQLNYNIFLAKTAHTLGLAVDLKNDPAQLPQLIHFFDFFIVE